MSDYAGAWTPQSPAEARWMIDTGARTEDAFWKWGEERAQELVPYMPSKASVVVDYGCGMGRVLRHMPGERRIGVDVSAEMLDYARAYVPDCEFVQGDGWTLPLIDKQADFIYSLLCLQHMDAADAANIVKECYHVLRPKGTCFLQFSGFGFPWGPATILERKGKSWTGKMDDSWCAAHNAIKYTPEIIGTLAEAAGFKRYTVESNARDERHPYHALVATR